MSRSEKLDAINFLDGIEIFVDVNNGVMIGMALENVCQEAVDAIAYGENYKLSKNKDMILN